MASESSVRVGGVQIGGGAPVVVQSMTLTKTHDVPATTAQIAALVGAGWQVVRAAKQRNTPMRIGANSGSLPKHLEELAQQDQAEALVEAALEEVRLLEQLDYRNFKISVKSSHVPTMIRAYRILASKVPYPLHLGVTEAGPPSTGAIKSAIGLGSLLADGIGDTIRVSLTADPVEEVKVAWEILKSLGLRERGPILIACPSCGRDNVGVQTLAEEVEERLLEYPEHFGECLH